MKVKVWDLLNETEEQATEYEVEERPDVPSAFAAQELAERYAEEDVDGSVDRIYENGHDIVVLFPTEPENKRYVVTVHVEYIPEYSSMVKPDDC